MLKLKLIAENPDVFDNFEVIEEQSNRNSSSNLYVKGPFIGCNVVNKNSRMYKLDDTRTEVQRYVNEMVMPGRAMGELNHPSSADVNLERACHLVTELAEVDDYFIGKAKVLSTPTGQILRSLINDGVRIGMSTRALGQLSENQNYSVVQNMHLVAIDAVADPSYPKAFVNGILESASFVVNQDGRFEQIYEDFGKSLKTLPKHDIDNYLRQQIINFIQRI